MSIKLEEYIPALNSHPFICGVSILRIDWAAPIVIQGKSCRSLHTSEYEMKKPQLEIMEAMYVDFCSDVERGQLRELFVIKIRLLRELYKAIDNIIREAHYKPKHINTTNRKTKINQLKQQCGSTTQTKWKSGLNEKECPSAVREILENSICYHYSIFAKLLNLDKVPSVCYNFYMNKIDHCVAGSVEKFHITLATFSNDFFVCKNKIWYRPNVLVLRDKGLMFDCYISNGFEGHSVPEEFVDMMLQIDTDVKSKLL